MFWYYFAKPNQMVEHNFTDDVALTKAWTKRGAIKKFLQLYADVQHHEVNRVSHRFCIRGVWVLTDY